MKLYEIEDMLREFKQRGATSDSDVEFMVCNHSDNHETESVCKLCVNIVDMGEMRGEESGKDISFELYVNLCEENIAIRENIL